MKPLFVILQKNPPATGMELSIEIKRGSLATVELVEFTLDGFQEKVVS